MALILQQYIQEVLFRQRVCVVPQLGTFTLQHFPAQYNAAAQTLTAPRDQVTFSRSWQDDGSCLEWIALKENLVPAVAQRKLEKYLEDLKTTLQSGKPLHLPGIGQLQGDFTGNIHFHPEELPVDQESLPIAPINRQDATDTLNTTNITATSATPDTTPASTTPDYEQMEPVMTAEEEETLDAVAEESIFKWWWAIAGIVFIAGGLGTWWYVNSQTQPVETATPAPDIAATADSLQRVNAMADSLTAVAAADRAANDSVSYFVVIEEFTDSTKAARQVARRLGWEQNVVMYKRDDTYKVAAPVRSLPVDTTAELQKTKELFKTNKAYLEF
ncbi:hypothetical protein [Chitinophaga sp. MM2321]|uniref:HU domain-containing protein n=1 Tax=Chitinophaga sp. MM2321 TaxID=3137178 RepID=UPI0032D57026